MAKAKKKIEALADDVGKLKRAVKKLVAEQKALTAAVGKLLRAGDVRMAKTATKKVEAKLAKKAAPPPPAPKKRPVLVSSSATSSEAAGPRSS